MGTRRGSKASQVKDRAPERDRVRRGNLDDALALRLALCDAAMVLFREGGLQAVTMRAVASRVGVSAMTPYRYFSDKAELLHALWQRVIGALYDAIVSAVDAHTHAEARYRAAIEAFITYYEGHPDEFWLAYQTQQGTHESERPGAGQAEVYARLLALMHGLTVELAHAVGAGETHVRDAERLSLVFQLGYMQAAMVNRRYPWGDIDRLRNASVEQLVQLVKRCLVDGALPSAPSDLSARTTGTSFSTAN